MNIGLDFDGVICNVYNLSDELGIESYELTESDLINADLELLTPVNGAFDVINTGLVRAIITNRKNLDAVCEWFEFWLGKVPSKLISSKFGKGFECFKMGINVFVDDDPYTIELLDAWEVKGILYNCNRDGNLYKFLVKKGIFNSRI